MATKKLAKELGLIQKCRKSMKASLSIQPTKQDFDYILVLDFESTCWEMKSFAPEIIEFPVVLLDLHTHKILEEFQQFVFPVEHPALSDFCTKLTGISQSQVEQGVPLPTGLGLFSSWLKINCGKYNFVVNTNSSQKSAAFATWTDWDLGVCLHYECKRKNILKPNCFNMWIDVKASYKRFYGRNPAGLSGALKDVGLKFEGREHSGICDAKNTAFLMSKMIRDGCAFRITKTLR